MANRAHHLAADLLKERKRATGVPLNSRIDGTMATVVGLSLLKAGVHPAVAEEIYHGFERQLYAGMSEVESRGAEWRKAHGFGRKCSSGNAPGKGHGYGYGQGPKDAAERARARKAQKASRVRGRVAAGMRNLAASAKRMLFRGAARGS
jgi:hypothetical protein